MSTIKPRRVVIVITDTNVEARGMDIAFDVEGGIEPNEAPSAAIALGRLLMDHIKEVCTPSHRTLN